MPGPLSATSKRIAVIRARARTVTVPPPGRVRDRVADQVREHELDPLAIGDDVALPGQHLGAQRDPLLARPRPRRSAAPPRRRRRPRACAACSSIATGLDARQVEQLVDDRCSRSQSSRAAKSRSACLRVERPDRLLGAQVDRHAQRRQRRAELVRDRRHQIVLAARRSGSRRVTSCSTIVQPTTSPSSVVQRRGARQERRARRRRSATRDRLLEALGHVGAACPPRRAARSRSTASRTTGSAPRERGARAERRCRAARRPRGSRAEQLAVELEDAAPDRAGCRWSPAPLLRLQQLAERALAVALRADRPWC